MKEKIIEILLEVKKEIEPNLDNKNLVTEGLLDSLDIMRIITEFEYQLDVVIDPEDILSDNFESVDAMVALAEKCKNA